MMRSLILFFCFYLAAYSAAATQADSLDSTASGLGGGAPSTLYTHAMQHLEDRLARYPDDYEASLLKGVILFKSGQLDAARRELEKLTQRAPKFHLAHLVQGDLLLAQSYTITDVGRAPLLAKMRGGEPGQLERLRAEAEVRLAAYLDSLPQGRLPRALLALGESVKTALVVDKSSHRLYVFERDETTGLPRLLRDFYVSTGKADGNKQLQGDLRTPEGVYFLTSHIPQSQLPQKYGTSAYPLNYPNELDRRNGKTGQGIWLHGTDHAFYSRPPKDSEGCVVLPNSDLDRVGDYIRPGTTPLVVSEHLVWLEQEAWQRQRQELLDAIEAWRSDWESGDVEHYLSHYDRDFWANGYNLAKWQQRKRDVASGKSFQKVGFSDLSIFSYPEGASAGRDMVVVNLHQDYRSNNFNGELEKRVYMAKEGGRWLVLYEGGQ